MPRPRSNKSPHKGGRTSFGKRSDAEKSYRKGSSSSRPDSDSKRSFSKPSGYRKSSAADSFRAPGSFRKNDSESSGARPGRDSDRKGRTDFKPRSEGSGSFSKPFRSAGSEGGKRPFKRDDDRKGGFRPRSEGSGSFSKPFRAEGGAGEKRSFRKDGDAGARPYREGSKRTFKSSSDSNESSGSKRFEKPDGGGFKKSFSKGGDFRKSDDRRGPSKPYGADRGKRPFHKDDQGAPRPERREPTEDFETPVRKTGDFEKRSVGSFSNNPEQKSFGKEERKSFEKTKIAASDFSKPSRKPKEESFRDKSFKESKEKDTDSDGGLMRLNKHVANSGVGSRREADKLITMGLISVNGVTITELGTKVKQGDVVRYEDRILKAEKPVYILLNKPKGFITTTDDPQERNTVMGLVAGACKERIYPVGRLDRNTTGLLLLTNDGDLADKLTHPSYKAKKVYKVELDKPFTKNDFQKVLDGVHLEEGRAMVDDLAIISDDNKTVGLEIHIGWNRVVRRIFETLGYVVVKLDRSVYAGLDKKDTPRGNWRFLKPEEIVMLKHFK